jgi:ribosomal protein S18 acetylase RimI-like enzyme
MSTPGAPRPATAADVDAVAALVAAAYTRYIERLGRRPAPMDDDHAAHVRRGEQFVLEDAAGSIVGAVVLSPRDDHLFVDNLAVDPAAQGRGWGRTLLAFAEAAALTRGLTELRLRTNAAMTENLEIYPHLGYERTGRQTVGIYERVSFRKGL